MPAISSCSAMRQAEDCVMRSAADQGDERPSVTPFSRPDAGRPPVAGRSRACIFGPEARRSTTRILPRETVSGITAGPAIIEDAWSTVIVPPGWQARPDDLGNLFLTRSAA